MDSIFRDSFVFYKSFLDAMVEMDGDTVKETLFAIAQYAMEGKEPETLNGWGKSVFVMAKPQIDANADRYEASLNGGRPQKELPSLEELEAMRAAFDNWEAVADELKVNKATLFRHMKRLRHTDEEVAKQSQNLSQKSQNLSQVAKPNVNDNDNDNVNANVNANENEKDEQVDKQVERGGVQSPPAILEADNLSQNSVRFPVEQINQDAQASEKPKKHAKTFVPPTVEEVEAYCKERGYNIDAAHFVAYYTASNWHLSNGKKMKYWRQTIATWVQNDKKSARAQYRSRASPVSETRDSDGWNAAHTVL